jgi:predicted Zn-dependent protease
MPPRLVLLASPILLPILASPTSGQTPQTQSSVQIKKEFSLGQSLAKDLERRDGLIGDPSILSYVQSIADRLAATTGARVWEVRLTRGSDWYAYLTPHGLLYISGSLMERLENEAELAGLLAHELAHTASKIPPAHGQTIPLLVPPCILALRSPPIGWSPDRRQSEMQANSAALRMLKDSGYEPSAVLDLLSKLTYERPTWSRALPSEDLLGLRAATETDAIPQNGYRIDSSEFLRQRAKVAAELGHVPAKQPSLF